MTGLVVAIDDPNYAGKTTVCLEVLKKLERSNIVVSPNTGISGGTCYECHERRTQFAAAGISDSVVYLNEDTLDEEDRKSVV